MALLGRDHGGAPGVVSAHFRCTSEDPLGVRGLVVALKLVGSVPFRFVCDDPLGVSGACGHRGLVVMPKLAI